MLFVKRLLALELLVCLGLELLRLREFRVLRVWG